MGKASRRKQMAEITEQTRQGVRWAAEIIRDPRILRTFPALSRLESRPKTDMASALGTIADALGDAETAQSFREMPWHTALAARQLRELKPEEWAEGMTGAFNNAKFSALITQATAIAHKQFWSSDPSAALQYGGNSPAPADDPRALAITRAHRRLTADPVGPGWVTLGLFCMGRMIAVNSQRLFDSDEWTDATFLWFDLESKFLSGDGVNAAKLLVKADQSFFGNKLPELIGSRMLHGLAEAAVNAYDTKFFE